MGRASITLPGEGSEGESHAGGGCSAQRWEFEDVPKHVRANQRRKRREAGKGFLAVERLGWKSKQRSDFKAWNKLVLLS